MIEDFMWNFVKWMKSVFTDKKVEDCEYIIFRI